MERNETEVRADVERVLDLRLRLEMFRVGSQMGRMAIHESRVGRKRPVITDVEPQNAEERSERRLAITRRAVYAPAARRREIGTPRPGIDDHVLVNVIPSREVAAIVRVKSGHGSSRAATDGDTQLWCSTIDTKLGRMARSCAFCMPNSSERCKHVAALITAAKLRIRIESVRAVGSIAERELGSRTRRKRLTRSGVEAMTDRRNNAKSLSRDLMRERMTITRSVIYEEAIELFDIACSEDDETRAYCYRETVIR